MEENEGKVFALIPDGGLDLKETDLGDVKADGGLRMKKGPPMWPPNWEALVWEEETWMNLID